LVFNNSPPTFLTASLIALVLFSSSVSATITFPVVPTLSQSGNSDTIKITSTENETVSLSINDVEGIIFTVPSTVVLTAGIPSEITINYNIPSGFDFDFGQSYSTTLTVTDSSTPTPMLYTQRIYFQESDYKSIELQNNLPLTEHFLNEYVKRYATSNEKEDADFLNAAFRNHEKNNLQKPQYLIPEVIRGLLQHFPKPSKLSLTGASVEGPCSLLLLVKF